MYYGVGIWGTRELWNHSRTFAYAELAGIKDKGLHLERPACVMPSYCDGDDGIYRTPELDNAPWYDPSFSESKDAAGIYVTDIGGLESFGSREVVPTAFGSTVSRVNPLPKTLTISAVLVGKTCCATQYLLRWLTARLQEKSCLDGSDTSSLSLYDCCVDTAGLSQEQVEQYLCGLYQVKTVAFPSVDEKLGTCCDDCTGSTLSVSWTFVVGNPRIYKKYELVSVDGSWSDEVFCVDFDCLPCEPEETLTVEHVHQKTRLPIKLKDDGTFCPIGWEVDEDHFPPEDAWIDIVEVEAENRPLQIAVGYNRTWQALGWDPTLVDLCNVNIAIAKACSNTGITRTLPEECSELDAPARRLGIELTVTSTGGGTWVEQGWNFDAFGPLPPLFSELFVVNECGCTVGLEEAKVVLSPDLTWLPNNFSFSGILPPIGFSGLRVHRSYPGTYVATEQVPVADAFKGSFRHTVAPPSPYEVVGSSYCQPLEWVRQCVRIPFETSVIRGEPYIEFHSGSADLYNFKAEFYRLASPSDGCLCDEDIDVWACKEPDFVIQAGRSIPKDSILIFDPRLRSYTIYYDNVGYDASGFVSGKDGGNPFFFEFPECFGVCVVLTAEVHNGVKPAQDSMVTVGYIPYMLVGV